MASTDDFPPLSVAVFLEYFSSLQCYDFSSHWLPLVRLCHLKSYHGYCHSQSLYLPPQCPSCPSSRTRFEPVTSEPFSRASSLFPARSRANAVEPFSVSVSIPAFPSLPTILWLAGTVSEFRRSPPAGQISAEDSRRLLKFVRLEALKHRLERIQNDCISYEELLRVCMESEGSSMAEARGIAKLLDESGHILILNNTLYLHPDKIARAFEKAMPVSVAPKRNLCREELQKLEKEKAEIDQKAKSHAMTKLRLGLGFFGLQTAGLMRLTFWELTWDVMEPVCYFLASIYFMVGYLFFLNTTTNPSFKSFFNTRFSARQSRLMKKRNFDIERLRELRRLSRPELKSSYCCRGIYKF